MSRRTHHIESYRPKQEAAPENNDSELLDKLRKKILPVLFSALILFPSKTGPAEYTSEQHFKDYLEEKIPDPGYFKKGIESFKQLLASLNLSTGLRDSLDGEINTALEIYEQEASMQDEHGKRKAAFELGSKVETVSEHIPELQRRRIERISEAVGIYEQVHSLEEGAVSDPSIERYLAQARITQEELVTKTKEWLEGHTDSIEQREIMVLINKGEYVFNHVEPLNYTEEDIIAMPIFTELDKGVHRGDVMGIPGSRAERLLGDVTYRDELSAAEHDEHIRDKDTEFRKSPRYDSFSASKKKAVRSHADTESWVVMDNGYRISEKSLDWFLDLKLALAKEGYFIGISSTDEGGHSSIEHYTWDALDIKAYKILGRVPTGKGDSKRESLIISQVDRKGSLEFEQALGKYGIAMDGDNRNEYRNPVGHTTGGHFHISVTESVSPNLVAAE